MPGHTVLLGEDYDSLRQIFSSHLEPSYDVRAVATGDSLLGELDGTVDAVVVDWRIHGTSEWDLLGAITDSPADPALIVVSGSAPAQDLTNHGADAFLQKPFQGETLKRTVRHALQGSETQTEQPRIRVGQ